MVESGDENSSQSEVRLHSLQCRDKGIEHSHSFQRKKFGSHRNDNLISCKESVCGDDSQRWRTVYENVVIVLLHGFEQSAQQLFSCQEIGQGNLCACHFEGGRNEVEVLPDVLHWQGCAFNQRVKDACLHLIFIRDEIQGKICLTVKVYEQDFLAHTCHASPDGGCRGGLRNATFMIGECNDFQ